VGPSGSPGATAAASAPMAGATAGSRRRWWAVSGTRSIRSGCWAASLVGRRPAAAATGRPPRPPSSASPAGAVTVTTAISPIPTTPTATGPAAAWTAALAVWNAMAARSWQKGAAHGPAPNPDPDKDEDDLEALGTPFYQGTGLSVRALTAEELQQFLDAHADQSAEVLGSGLAALDRPGHPLTVPRTPPGAEPAPPQPQPRLPAQHVTGSLGHPGRSALTQYRRRRAAEWAAWTPSLTWRALLLMAAGLVAGALAAQAGLPGAGLAGLTVAVLAGWRLRFRPSPQARAWQRGATGERHTARLLDRLGRDGYVSFHDLAMPDTPANLDHLVVGPSGVFVIDSKQWTGQVHQSPDGLVWHDHYRLDRTLATIGWQAETLGRLLGVPVAPLVCVHGAHIQGGGLRAQGVAVVPASLLRLALGSDQVLSDTDIERYAATTRMRLRPAA
jgi:hypothetical protein